MKLLLDTHIFLWLPSESHRLSIKSRKVIADPSNYLYLSIVSIWEIQIKVATGKLQLPIDLKNFVNIYCGYNDIQVISVIEQHIWALSTLPHHHRDPFDRMLIAQAIQGDLTLVSVDPIFADYPVRLLGVSSQS